MPRYFLEVFYKGEGFSGFQVQKNAVTIQSEIEKAFEVFFRKPVSFTGSSRTDAGVHALQNYFHFDWEDSFPEPALYNINAILPPGIVVKSAKKVKPEAHCRFHASSREYKYYIFNKKNPFLDDRAWYLPYTVDKGVLDDCAELVKQYNDFTAFSKQNTQVKTFQCTIIESRWLYENGCLTYHVKANRFLRGMVRGLVGTMIRVARGNITVGEFEQLIKEKNQATADFSAPAKGLFLVSVTYPGQLFEEE
jgi:tRNA pseudouridine38-40 synthase